MADRATLEFEFDGSLVQTFARAVDHARARGFEGITEVSVRVDLMENVPDPDTVFMGCWKFEVRGYLQEVQR